MFYFRMSWEIPRGFCNVNFRGIPRPVKLLEKILFSLSTEMVIQQLGESINPFWLLSMVMISYSANKSICFSVVNIFPLPEYQLVMNSNSFEWKMALISCEIPFHLLQRQNAAQYFIIIHHNRVALFNPCRRVVVEWKINWFFSSVPFRAIDRSSILTNIRTRWTDVELLQLLFSTFVSFFLNTEVFSISISR